MAPVQWRSSPARPPLAMMRSSSCRNLDTYVEHSMCSCNADDDNPSNQPGGPGRLSSQPGRRHHQG